MPDRQHALPRPSTTAATPPKLSGQLSDRARHAQYFVCTGFGSMMFAMDTTEVETLLEASREHGYEIAVFKRTEWPPSE